jgi:hypothetical protein
MIITFPFEDDPYYTASLPVQSYPHTKDPISNTGMAAFTPVLVQKYINLAQSASGGIFPVGENRFWHGGVHLQGLQPIRAVADGTIVAYRLDNEYADSELAKKATPPQTRQLSGSFVLIRHEFEANNGRTSINRYQGAHFYTLYMNLMCKRELEAKNILPPFLTTDGDPLPINALRGDDVVVLATNPDAHHLIKLRIKDINSGTFVEGWAELMQVDTAAGTPAVGATIKLTYPITRVFKCHPTEKRWRALDSVQKIGQPVRVGEVIGYAGVTDSPTGVVPDSFHFEVFAAGNLWVKPMKALIAVNLTKPSGARDPGAPDPSNAHQEYQDGTKGDCMGKVWLTRDADLFTRSPDNRALNNSHLTFFPKGSCFVAAIPCGEDGKKAANLNALRCFKLYDIAGRSYYAYINQLTAQLSQHIAFCANAWVTLTTDTDWMDRGWLAYQDKELNAGADGFVEDDDAVMLAILAQAGKQPQNLTAADLQTQGMGALLRKVAVQFHTEWDSANTDQRYQKLTTGTHPPLPKLEADEFNAFKNDAATQQFWSGADVKTDGVDNSFQPRTSPMDAKNWHFHPIGFLGQMRECLTTEVVMSEESYEREIRENWWIALQLVEKRLRQMAPWANPANTPAGPVPPPNIPKQYLTPPHSIPHVAPTHNNLWSNFEYWFGVPPNTLAAPTNNGGVTLPNQKAGHHIYNYMKGMQTFLKHVSMQRVMKGAAGFDSGAYVYSNSFPVAPLVPAQSGFTMEYINIGCQYEGFRAYSPAASVEQNRMELQLHEIAHMTKTAYAKDNEIALPPGQADPQRLNGKTAYGAMYARVLAETNPNMALANAENIAFFIESAKNEP